MNTTIKVRNLIDNTYQVVEFTPSDDERYEYEDESVLYQGSLSDCEVFIRLRESDYL
jgi:hypothetical protein